MKEFLKKSLKAYTTHLPFRGRHKMVNYIGGALSSSTELLEINRFNIEIDHSEYWCRLVYYGIYEEPLINFLKNELRPGDIVFDPGTNMGYITAVCLGLVGEEGHVYAFEPSKTCYDKLSGNNKLENIQNLSLYHAAISSKNGESVFCDTPRVISRGYACLAELDEPQDKESYPIQTYGIEQFCRENQVDQIRFLKLDIEGAELLALQGSEKMLMERSIDYILVETSFNKKDAELDANNQAIFKILLDNGYQANLLRPNGKLSPIKPFELDQIRRDVIWKKSALAAIRRKAA